MFAQKLKMEMHTTSTKSEKPPKQNENKVFFLTEFLLGETS